MAPRPPRALSLLARIVGRIDERDVRRPDAVNLDQRLFGAREREVPMRGGDANERADLHLGGGLLVEDLAHTDEEDAGKHRDVLAGLVEVRRDLVVRREFDAVDEEALLARVA